MQYLSNSRRELSNSRYHNYMGSLYILINQVPILPVPVPDWEKSPKILRIENPTQIFGNIVHDSHQNDLPQQNKIHGLGFYEIPFLPVTGRKGPKNAKLLSAQIFHSFLMRN